MSSGEIAGTVIFHNFSKGPSIAPLSVTGATLGFTWLVGGVVVGVVVVPVEPVGVVVDVSVVGLSFFVQPAASADARTRTMRRTPRAWRAMGARGSLRPGVQDPLEI